MDRWGSEIGYAIMGGQKVQVQRLRVRDKQKKEVAMESNERFQDENRRTEAIFTRMFTSVNDQKYAMTVEEFSEGYWISKSVISCKVVVATAEHLRSLCERDLSAHFR